MIPCPHHMKCQSAVKNNLNNTGRKKPKESLVPKPFGQFLLRFSEFSSRMSLSGYNIRRSALVALVFLPINSLSAQEELLRPGEAYVTRFSGTAASNLAPNNTPVVSI